MNNLFIAYVATVLLPLLFHSWRVAVIGLGIQGFLLGMICLGANDFSLSIASESLNLFLVRGFLVPWVLFHQMRNHELSPSFSLIKKSLAQWILATSLIVMAFMFGKKMCVVGSIEALQVGAAGSGILIGLLVLANQQTPFGQIVGLLTFEGGITLVELLSPHAMPIPVYLIVSFVFVVFVLTCGQYLSQFVSMKDAEAPEHGEGSL